MIAALMFSHQVMKGRRWEGRRGFSLPCTDESLCPRAVKLSKSGKWRVSVSTTRDFSSLGSFTRNLYVGFDRDVDLYYDDYHIMERIGVSLELWIQCRSWWIHFYSSMTSIVDIIDGMWLCDHTSSSIWKMSQLETKSNLEQSIQNLFLDDRRF